MQFRAEVRAEFRAEIWVEVRAVVRRSGSPAPSAAV